MLSSFTLTLCSHTIQCAITNDKAGQSARLDQTRQDKDNNEENDNNDRVKDNSNFNLVDFNLELLSSSIM